MRLIALVLTAGLVGALVGGPAAAQEWKEYSYPGEAFTVSFPAEPTVETTTYQTVDGRSVEAHVYSVKQDGSTFRMTIAEVANSSLADPGPEEGTVIDHAINTLSQGGEVKLNIPHRINRIFGRQISVAWPDGSRLSAAVFYNNGRLYQIEAKTFPVVNMATAEAIRFQQSLMFTGGGSNRPPGTGRDGRPCPVGTDVAGITGTPGAAAADEGLGRRGGRGCARRRDRAG
jgi:hypothetical protein